MLEKERFKKAIEEYEELSDPREIGIMNERMLHAVIKSCIADSENELEVKIGGRNIADVLKGNTIYEIQTESLFPVKKKLDFYFSNTEYNVNVVFPVPREKYVCWADPENGELSKRNRSPKKRTLADYADTLIFLTDYIGDARLTFTVLYISECEYRNLDGKRSKDKKRGSTRIERVPIELLWVEEYKTKDDYRCLLPEEGRFTSKTYAKDKKLTSGRKVAYAIKMMLNLGMIRICGKEGRYVLYETI